MTIRKILAPLMGAERDSKVLGSAFALAKGMNAHVAALFVNADPANAFFYYDPPASPDVIEEAYAAIKEASRNSSKIAHMHFEKAAHAASAPMVSHPKATTGLSGSFAESTGLLGQRVSAYAAFSDLVVFGPAGEGDGELVDAFLDTLRHSGTPVLFTPGLMSALPRTVALGWDGSAAAMRAIKSAMPLLEHASEVKIIMVRKPGEHTPLLKSMKDYLSIHGIPASEEVVDPGEEPIGERLVATATRLKADLLVMGGYGQHGYWREAIFGGVTSYVRAHSKLPVLMVH